MEGTGGGLTGSLPPLRESSKLSGGGCLSLAALMSSGPAGAVIKDTPKPGTTFLLEGIPSLSSRLVERIQAWQYVDLAELLTDMTAKTEEPLLQATEGQILLVQSTDQVKRRRKKITDVATWAQAFSIYVAALASADSTSKVEVASLMAHQHVILQIHKDLRGMRWLQYDQQYREWAAATKKRVWGEINLTIYGWCLCTPASSPVLPVPTKQPGLYGKKGAAKKGRRRTGLASSTTLKKYAQGRRRSAGLTTYVGIVEQQTMWRGSAGIHINGPEVKKPPLNIVTKKKNVSTHVNSFCEP